MQASSVRMVSLLQRKTLLALEKEEEEERNKTIESLKTALRTQPMRSAHCNTNIYTVSHRSEYTPHIFVNILLYIFMLQH